MSKLSLDQVIDRCIDDIATGRRDVDECLAAYPDHAEALRPLLQAAFAVNALPRIPDAPPSAERRAAFMAELSRTPQAQPRRSFRLPRPRLFTPGMSLARLLAAAGPAAAAVAVVAVAAVLLVGRGATPASASTLTVFTGTVQQDRGGQWQPITDGTMLSEGAHLRTSAGGRAMITFPDGSTTTLDASTELVLQQVHVDGVRDITLDQRTGRLWNDVVPDHRPGAAYIVRTPDAIAQAVGTVFETHIVGGVTSVTTARGLVHVQSGDQQVQVAEGEAVHLAPNTVAQTQKVTPQAQVSVDAPYVASLIAPDGAATGARPDGVTFSQVAGVTTTNPGTGPQSIDVLQAEPGDYTLLLRPFADGNGNVVIHTSKGDVSIPVTNGTERKVALRLSVVDGHATLEVLNDGKPTAASTATAERVVPTKRTEHVVGVAEQRAEEAKHHEREGDNATGTATATGTGTATATATTRRGDGGDEGDRGGSRDGHATPTPTGTPLSALPATPVPSVAALRQQLVAALASGNADAIRQQLTQAFGANSPLSDLQRRVLLDALSADPAAGPSLQAFLATDTSAIAQQVSAALGPAARGTPPAGEPEDGEQEGPAPGATPRPERRGRDGGRESEGEGGGDRGFSPQVLPGLLTPTATAGSATGLLPAPTPLPRLRDRGDDGEGGGDD
jgi:hypothetical protein